MEKSAFRAKPGGTTTNGPVNSTADAERLRLSAALEAALLRELRDTYHDMNARYFRRSLRPPSFELSDALGRLGQWDPAARTIHLSRKLILEKPWGVVVEVLKHEMAHQFVHENLQRIDEPAHGPAFREACTRMGIDSRATGVPSGPTDEPVAGERDQRLLERVRRLLALAESNNLNEAQAAANAAQRLMLKYNLESASEALVSEYGFRHLGAPTGRVDESRRILSIILNEHFFVEVIWVPAYRPLEQKRGHLLEICGTRTNLEMAAYVHDFLTQAADRLWLEHKKNNGIRANRERRTYLAGVMEGFREKLEAQKVETREQGLVWVGDVELTQFYRRRHPHIQHTRTRGNAHTAARNDGRAAGRNLVLHRGISARATNAGLLLGPGKR